MSPTPVPPRFVPTLTEVVTPGSAGLSPARPGAAPRPAALASTPEGEEQMIARIMQRLDLVLERRLRETLGQLMLTQTQAVLPRLRQELEPVVQGLVQEALREESRAELQRRNPDQP